MASLYWGLLILCGWLAIGNVIALYTWDDDDTEVYWSSSVIDRTLYIVWISVSWPSRFIRKS